MAAFLRWLEDIKPALRTTRPVIINESDDSIIRQMEYVRQYIIFLADPVITYEVDRLHQSDHRPIFPVQSSTVVGFTNLRNGNIRSISIIDRDTLEIDKKYLDDNPDMELAKDHLENLTSLLNFRGDTWIDTLYNLVYYGYRLLPYLTLWNNVTMKQNVLNIWTQAFHITSTSDRQAADPAYQFMHPYVIGALEGTGSHVDELVLRFPIWPVTEYDDGLFFPVMSKVMYLSPVLVGMVGFPVFLQAVFDTSRVPLPSSSQEMQKFVSR